MIRLFHKPSRKAPFPLGKSFAFSIFDDTDVATLQSVMPVYDLLTALGMRTTKTVWPLSYNGNSDFAGSHTLEDSEYAKYIRELSKRGFEIAFHGATMASSERAETLRALGLFRETLGFYPRSCAAHAVNRENLYWGAARFGSHLLRRMYTAVSKRPTDFFQGHIEGTPWFWGDIAKQHFDYVRSFTFNTIDLWALTPHVCYEDSETPWVNHWFITADAESVEEFVELMNEANVDRLEREGGLCLLSTHFGKGFVNEGNIEKRAKHLLMNLARRNGWFVPVSEILDFLRASGLVNKISGTDRRWLELTWFLHAVRRRLKHKR